MIKEGSKKFIVPVLTGKLVPSGILETRLNQLRSQGANAGFASERVVKVIVPPDESVFKDEELRRRRADCHCVSPEFFKDYMRHNPDTDVQEIVEELKGTIDHYMYRMSKEDASELIKNAITTTKSTPMF